MSIGTFFFFSGIGKESDDVSLVVILLESVKRRRATERIRNPVVFHKNSRERRSDCCV